MKEIKKIIHGYNPMIFDMYLKHEAPIIKLISDEEFQLAISYAALLQARRKYFYKGLELSKKYNEISKFKKSKSYKLFKVFSVFRKLKK